MKIFISSVISGFEPFRNAVEQAAKVLRHTVIRAESFGASPTSPQRACLAAVRAADVVVLLMGERYGSPGPSGLSPTHEEYREARETKDVLAFIQRGVSVESAQKAFLTEVQNWSQGKYTEEFSALDELKDAVVRALHQLEVERNSGGVDEDELLSRATELLPQERGRGPRVVVAVSGGPKQQVIRPAQLETPGLAASIKKAALFGPNQIFDQEEGSKSKVTGVALFVEQESASVLLTQLGDVVVTQPATKKDDSDRMHFTVLIEEDIQEAIERALSFAGWVLNEVDERHRLSRIAPVAALTDGSFAPWLTRAQARANRNGLTMSASNRPTVVNLSPVSRPRPAIEKEAKVMAEDLMVLMRRERKA